MKTSPMNKYQCQQILQQCERSSQIAFECFKTLLVQLDDPSHRTDALDCLRNLQQLFDTQSLTADEALQRYHFAFITMDVATQGDESEQLVLLQLPSIFTPETWSFTFFEGILRYDAGEFFDKHIAELGCGNGWVSIAMAKKFAPARITGLDINPRAVVSARINLYLNAYDAQAQPIYDAANQCLTDRVRFFESDLLGYFFEQRELLDCVIGCIPQVLNPDENAFLEQISESTEDALLVSLSNYTSKQGFVEDQFGLGLIARTVEEAIELLKPDGRIILNLGGRPGKPVLKRLFTRRGLQCKKIWQRKVVQAADTDIEPLVHIEQQTAHRFEFFLHHHSKIPISAKTAQQYLAANGKILHNLTVYECRAPFLKATREVLRLIHDENYGRVRDGLDLEYTDLDQQEEKINFLAKLAVKLKDLAFFPYAETQGDRPFRERIAGFINAYFYTTLSEEQVLVAPNLVALIDNILHLYQPSCVFFVPSSIRLNAHDFPDINLLEVPARLSELCTLISAIQPNLVFTVLLEQNVSRAELEQLFHVTQSVGARLFIDISAVFELNSTPETNAVFNYLSTQDLPLHVTLLCGLSKNKVYQALEVAFAITHNLSLLRLLRDAAELSYSRTALLTQFYYSVLIEDLLRFVMSKVHSRPVRSVKLLTEDALFEQQFGQVREHVLNAFAHPSIQGNTFPINAQTLRLDYGENELDSPTGLKVALFEAFAKRHISDAECDPGPEIRTVLRQRFGLVLHEQTPLLYGNGVAALYAAIIRLYANESNEITLIFPQGAYGSFLATALFYHVPVIRVPTQPECHFKLDPLALSQALQSVKKPVIFLNLPLVNPTGAQYSMDELEAILQLPAVKRSCLIIDTVFSGLEFDGVQAMPQLGARLQGISHIILGGISKEYAAGGLRFGYLMATDVELFEKLKSRIDSQPHATVRYAFRQLYRQSLSDTPLKGITSGLEQNLHRQQQVLKDRAEQLTQVLTECGWDVLAPSGGLFLVAKPSRYLGCQLTYRKHDRDVEVVLDSDNITEVLFDAVNLLINNSTWTGIPDHCRFVLSVAEPVFLRALASLPLFDRWIIEHRR